MTTSIEHGPAWTREPLNADDSTLWRRWGDCLRRSFRGHAMLDPRFLRPLVSHFGQRELELLTCGPREQPLAMMIVESRRRGVYSVFRPGQVQVAPVLCPAGLTIDIPKLFAALPAGCFRFDLLCIDLLYFGARLVPPEKVESTVHAVTTAVDSSSSFGDFWGARPKKLRDNVKRYRRRAEDEGLQPRFVVHREAPAVIAALRRYGELESAGWKGRAGTAVRADNDQGAFYAEVLEQFARTGEAFAFELYFGEQLVASRLVVTSGGMAILLKTTFDESFSRFAPGRIAFHETLAALFEIGGITAIETYTNAQREQVDWADSTREIMHYSLYRHAMLRRSIRFVRRTVRPQSVELNFKLECLTDFDDVPKAMMKWWEEYGAVRPFSSPGWYQNLYSHIGPDIGQLCLVTLFDRAEQAQAMLPCVRRASASGAYEYAALANYYTPNYELVLDDAQISREAALERIFDALSLRDDWTSMTLFPMMETPDLALLRSAARRNLLACAAFEETANWTHQLDGIEAYRASLPPALRSTLARKSARLAREGAARFEVVTAPREAAAAVRDFDQVYRSSWKPEEPYAGFISDLVALAARNGWLRLGLLYIDEAPVAAQIWLVHDRTASIYKLAYDNAYRSWSPGTLLTMHLIEHVVREDGVTRLDYLTGDDTYKRDWMSSRAIMMRVRIANPRTAGGVHAAAYDALRLLKRHWLG